MVFGMLFSIILGACFIFGMEYHNHTAAYVFTTPASRIRLLAAKIIAVFLIITFSHITSFISTMLFGYLTVNEFIPGITAAALFKSFFPIYAGIFFINRIYRVDWYNNKKICSFSSAYYWIYIDGFPFSSEIQRCHMSFYDPCICIFKNHWPE